MRRLILTICLAVAGTAFAADARRPVPTRLVADVSFGSKEGCRVRLIRSAPKRPYWRRYGREYRLAADGRQFLGALRRSGRDRGSATIKGGSDVPRQCSGQVLEAARLAGFRQVGFWLPSPAASAGAAEPVSVCEVTADPARFGGRRIKLRGWAKVVMTPDGIHYTLVDMDCGGGISIHDGEAAISRYLTNASRVVSMSVTGAAGVSTCDNIPPGSTCGPFFIVETFDAVERPDLCWDYVPAGRDRFRLITKPCPPKLTP
jgi:hypothetical protein